MCTRCTLDVIKKRRCVSLATTFVFDEKSKNPPKPSESMAAPLRVLQDTARRVAKICTECKIVLDEEEYVDAFRTEMMGVAFEWVSLLRGV